MDWTGLSEPVAIPRLLAVLILLGVAACLLWFDRRSRARWGFALFCASFAAAVFFNTMGALARTPEGAAGWFPLTKFAGIVEIPALVMFASHFPRRRGLFGRSDVALAAMWLVAGILMLAVAADPTLWYASADGRSGLSVGLWGPVGTFLSNDNLAMGIVAVLLAFDYRSLDEGLRRRGVLLVWLGLAINVLYDSATSTAWTVRGLMGDVPFEPYIWNRVQYVLNLLALACGYIAFGAMMAALARGPDARRRDRILLMAALPIPVAAAIVETIVAPDVELFDSPFKLAVNGLLRIALALLPTYALLRYQLLDLDLRIRTTLRHTVALGLVGVATFTVGNVVQTQFEASSLVANLAIAAAIALLLWPAEWIAKRLLHRAMPDPSPQRVEDRRRELYRVAVQAAVEDGEVTAKERRMLDALALQLGLDHVQAARIEGAAGMHETAAGRATDVPA